MARTSTTDLTAAEVNVVQGLEPLGSALQVVRVNAGGTALEYATAGAGDALTANPLSQFAATTSLELKGVISDETGSGALVFADTPTLVTPVLGVATATSINGATITSGTLNGSVTGTNTGDQTIANTSDATSHTATLSATGGSIKLVEGTNITLTTTGTSADGIVTIAATGGGTGTVTATAGSLTSNAVVLGAGTTDTKVSTGITTDGTAQLNLGVNATTIGKVKMFGNTSGDVTIQPTAAAGTATVQTLPATTGTLVNRVTTANGVSASNSDGALTVSLGAIAPTTVNTVTISGASTPTLAVTGTTTVSGTNTGNQTIANTSDATSHTVTLSASGGSVQLIEGSNITLTTGGTGSAGTITIASTGGSLSNFTEAVNTSAPNATVPVVSLTATNGATNVDAAWIPKGTGAVLTAIPDNLSSGGNKRGANSIDIQTSRSVNTQVASGTTATLIGSLNTASGNNSTAVGYNNTSSGSDSSSVGRGNFATGTQATAVGYMSDSSGTQATAVGYKNTASGTGSIALGYESTSQSYGETTLGLWATTGAGTAGSYVATDRLLVVGNGTSNAARANALTVLKNGNTTISGTIGASNLSGTNTGDQTSIVGITGTMAQFDTAVSDGNLVYQSQALGTPTSGTLTNCTGLPVAGITASTSTALGVGSIELGHASDTSIARVSAGVISVEGVTVPTISSTSTITNKRNQPRIVSAASYTTDTGTSLDVSTTDIFVITAQAGALLFNAPSGTPVQGEKLIIRIKDNGTARALTWNAVFRAMGTALPTTTILSKTLYLGLIYNSTDTKWDLVSSAQEA